MAQDWMDLTRLTGGEPILVERVRLVNKNIRIEGEFELPPLARLSTEDQVFVMAFIRGDGSIKEMEKTFGISYPTVKSRLAKIAQQFEFTVPAPPPSSQQEELLDQLEKGEITVDEAIRRLSQ